MTAPSPEPTREPDAWMDLLALQTAVFAYLDAGDTSPGSDARDALLTALGASSAAIAWRGPELPPPAAEPVPFSMTTAARQLGQAELNRMAASPVVADAAPPSVTHYGRPAARSPWLHPVAEGHHGHPDTCEACREAMA